MKKLIAFLMAGSMLAASSTVLAANTYGGALEDGYTGRNENTSLVSSVDNTTLMPCFRAGDVLKFDITGLTQNNTLTLISYKASAQSLSNTNIQYINEYKLTGTTQEVTYTIRDNDQGIYKLAFNDGTGDVATFFYKVATPVFATLEGENGEQYVAKSDAYTVDGVASYTIGFVGTVKIGTEDGITLKDAGVNNLGFKITANGKALTFGLLDQADGDTTEEEGFLSAAGDIEASEIIYYYGVEMAGVPGTETENIDAEAVELDKNGDIVE